MVCDAREGVYGVWALPKEWLARPAVSLRGRLLASNPALGRGVTVARCALDAEVQVRILAAQLQLPTTMRPHAVAVGADDVAFLDLLPEDRIRDQRESVSPDVEPFDAPVSMVEIHHVGWIARSAVGTRPILGLMDDPPDSIAAPLVPSLRRTAVLLEVPGVMPSEVLPPAFDAVRLHAVASARVA